MVMQVTSEPLQLQMDQWDHMFRFGINVPDSFLIHDTASFEDFFREWAVVKDLDRVSMFKYERESDEARVSLPTSIEMLRENISQDDLQNFYYLATPFVDFNEFTMSGWVRTPSVDDPFNIKYGLREDHRIPYEEDEEFPCKLMEFDHRNNIPHSNPFIGDIRRIACGFPYEGTRITWSITKGRIGRNNSNLCFYEYQVDPAFIRD